MKSENRNQGSPRKFPGEVNVFMIWTLFLLLYLFRSYSYSLSKNNMLIFRPGTFLSKD